MWWDNSEEPHIRGCYCIRALIEDSYVDVCKTPKLCQRTCWTVWTKLVLEECYQINLSVGAVDCADRGVTPVRQRERGSALVTLASSCAIIDCPLFRRLRDCTPLQWDASGTLSPRPICCRALRVVLMTQPADPRSCGRQWTSISKHLQSLRMQLSSGSVCGHVDSQRGSRYSAAASSVVHVYSSAICRHFSLQLFSASCWKCLWYMIDQYERVIIILTFSRWMCETSFA